MLSGSPADVGFGRDGYGFSRMDSMARSFIEPLEQRQLLSGNFEWAVSFGQDRAVNSGNAIATDADGNVYVAGNFQRVIDLDPRPRVTRTLVSDNRSQDIFLAKYTSSGQLVWAQRFGGRDEDSANAIAIGPGGDVYLAGTFERQASFGGQTVLSHGRRDAFVARISPDGDVRWVGKVGGSKDDFASAIAVDARGRVFLSGTIRLEGFVDPAGGRQAIRSRGTDATFVSRLNGANGRLEWIRHYGEEDTFESAQGLAPDDVGGVFVVGTFNRTVRFQGGDRRFTLSGDEKGDVYLGHLNARGNWRWLNAVGGRGEQSAVDIARGPNGLYITGMFDGETDFDPGPARRALRPQDGRDVFVARYTEAGRLVWARQIAGVEGRVLARGLAVDGRGNVFVAGAFSDRVDLDPGRGSVIAVADKRRGARPVRPQVAAPPFTLISGDATDSFIVKLSPRGVLSYGRVLEGRDGSIEARGISVDAAGAAHLTGAFSGTVDLDPGAGTQQRRAPTQRRANSVFVLKLDA
jgi:hypothetical protein